MDYSKLTISPENKALEAAVIKEIESCISTGQSWAFDAGAGAGKTFALIQSLNIVIDKLGNTLSAHRQKIMCITYTNAAADEIKNRLRNSSLVRVSTIHERLWDIIAPYHQELLYLHRKKLQKEISDRENSLLSDTWAQAYRDLSQTEQACFQSHFLKSETRDKYYTAQKGNAASIRTAFSEEATTYPGLIKNIASFKKIVQCLYTISDYSKALSRTKKKNCPHVTYDPRLNTDRLTKMRISHDTLLEYAYAIVNKSNCLKQIIFDQFPVVFVDEFQDTNPLVIKTIACVDRYAKKIQHPFIVGYYGDIRQNIYDIGVGAKLFRTHPGLVRIKKEFNRRCSPKIISVANSIRNDGLVQKSIYTTFPKSDVRYYVCTTAEHDSVIANLCDQWGITRESPLHCFELTNELVAKQSGFEIIYNFFKTSRYYKQGRRFELLKDHVLSQDVTKLNDVALLIYHLLDFQQKIQNDKTALNEILRIRSFKSEIRDHINITNLRNLVQKLRAVSGNTVWEYITQLFENYNTGDILYDECIDQVISEDISSPDQLKTYIQTQLFPDEQGSPLTEEERNNERLAVELFLQINLETFKHWYAFISDSQAQADVIYHTYHSTKGREFDNVLIFMTSKFGSNKSFFSDLLHALTSNTPATNDTATIGAARNLFYVAVTRAVKNLCVVYLVNDDEEKESVITALNTVFSTATSNAT